MGFQGCFHVSSEVVQVAVKEIELSRVFLILAMLKEDVVSYGALEEAVINIAIIL